MPDRTIAVFGRHQGKWSRLFNLSGFLLPPGYTLHSTSSRAGDERAWRSIAWVERGDQVKRCVREAVVLDKWRTPRNRRLAHLKAEQLVLEEVSRREYARLHGTTS